MVGKSSYLVAHLVADKKVRMFVLSENERQRLIRVHELGPGPASRIYVMDKQRRNKKVKMFFDEASLCGKIK